MCLSYLKISFHLWKLQNTARFVVLQTDVELTKLETVWKLTFETHVFKSKQSKYAFSSV